MPTPPKVLRELFNALPESATGGLYNDELYVNRAMLPDQDSVAGLLQFIDWTQTPNETYLFSGLRGSGKTTELNRLIAELRERNIAAYYCDASVYLNLNDPKLSLAELLMTALAGLSDALRKEFGTAFLSDNIWERTRRLLGSHVSLKPTFKAGAGGAELEIQATLQEQPDFRKALVEFASGSTSFYDAAAKFAVDVAGVIRDRTNCRKIVLVVDSLERISAPTGDEHVLFDSLKQVFYNEPARLRLPEICVVYSAPPYLHAVIPNVTTGFSQHVTLPSFKVIQRAADGGTPSRCEEGIDGMVEIVARRFPAWPTVFDRRVLEHLAWMSGGNVRFYFALIRSAVSNIGLNNSPLPLADIQSPEVARALNKAAEPLQWLTETDQKWLSRFMSGDKVATGQMDDLAKDLPSIIRLFDNQLVLSYMNGSVWYQVPQLVRDHV